MTEILLGASLLGVALLLVVHGLQRWGVWGCIGLLLLFLGTCLPYNARSDRLLRVSILGIWWSAAELLAVVCLVPLALYWVTFALRRRWWTAGTLRDIFLVSTLSVFVLSGTATNGMIAVLGDVRCWLVLIVEAGAVSLAQSNRRWRRYEYLQAVFSVLAAAMCLEILLNVILQPTLAWPSFRLSSRNDFGLVILLVRVIFDGRMRWSMRSILGLLIVTGVALTLSRSIWFTMTATLVVVVALRARFRWSHHAVRTTVYVGGTLLFLTPMVTIVVGQIDSFRASIQILAARLYSMATFASDASYILRAADIVTARRMWIESPLLGRGLGTSILTATLGGVEGIYIDNTWWTLLAKMGLVGTTIIVLLAVPLLRLSVLYIRRSGNILDVALGASIVCLGVLSLFGSIGHGEGDMMWLGLAWALMRVHGRNVSQVRDSP